MTADEQKPVKHAARTVAKRTSHFWKKLVEHAVFRNTERTDCSFNHFLYMTSYRLILIDWNIIRSRDTTDYHIKTGHNKLVGGLKRRNQARREGIRISVHHWLEGCIQCLRTHTVQNNIMLIDAYQLMMFKFTKQNSARRPRLFQLLHCILLAKELYVMCHMTIEQPTWRTMGLHRPRNPPPDESI